MRGESVDAGLAKKLQPAIFQAFKKKGLMLRPDATKYLVASMSRVDMDDWVSSLKKIVEAIDKESLGSNVLEKEAVEEAVGRLVAQANNVQTGTPANSIAVIDAFSIPQFVYDVDRKVFFPTRNKPTLFADGEAKATVFRERYTLILQRIQRHPLFCPPAILTDDAPTYHKRSITITQSSHADGEGCGPQLIPIDSLQGMGDIGESQAESQARSLTLLGMLSQLEEGKWYLEDLSGNVLLNLAQCKITTGLFVETTIVLVQGYYYDSCFHVLMMGLPPAENRETTAKVFKNINFFGGPSVTRDYDRLKAREESELDAFFVTLSDVWLDVPEVMTRLEVLFNGYADSPPVAFIFIGNFCSTPYGKLHYQMIQDGFDALGRLIGKYPGLVASTQFIFIPGPLDPGPGSVIPRPPLLSTLTQGLRAHVPAAIFTTNPCRLRYYTQEIVIFREDLVGKMHRHCVLPPSTTEGHDINHHFMRTLLDQGHLCPLNLQVGPIYWAHDHALRLYPLPDVVIVADRQDQYDLGYEGVQCFNPGPLVPSNFAFLVYWPATKKCDYSQIPKMNAETN